MTTTTHPPLTHRQRDCLTALAHTHQEFGPTTPITSAALTHLTAQPWAATLSTLVQYALVERQQTPDGIGYRLTEAGWCQHIGIDPNSLNRDEI